jgi:hypothetical protein
MILGSNNSLTYLEPSNWWFEFGQYFAERQEISIEGQYTYYGVRYFDFRLFVDEFNHIIAKHGTTKYPLFLFYEVLDYFNQRGDAIISITLDVTFNERISDRYPKIEKKFVETCAIIDTIYHDIHFVGGTRNIDDKKLYQFDWERTNEVPEIVKPTNWSILYRLVSKFCPMFIYKLNKKYIEKYKDKHVILVLNYVNRQ